MLCGGSVEIKTLKMSYCLDMIKPLADDFSELYNRKIDWAYFRDAMGALIDNKVAECIVCEKDNQVVGFLIYTIFPDLLSGESCATEMYWYASKNESSIGVKLLDEFIKNAKKKKASHINVTHLSETPEIGRFLKKKGFRHIETHHSMKVIY